MTIREVNISVTGLAGTGKSTILEIIAEALIAAGFKSVTISDKPNTQPLENRIDSLVNSELRINLGTHQTLKF